MTLLTEEEKKCKYQNEIMSMMYTFGDTRQAFPSSARLMEEIVRQNLVRLLIQASQVCQKKGSRFMTIEDVLFVIRHDTANVKRVLEFLSWKDVRKDAKNAGSKEQKDTLDADELDGEELEEAINDETVAKGAPPKRKKPRLSYDFYSSYYEYLDEEHLNTEEDVSGANMRLKQADELTKKMTVDEYIDYSDCRQASFTFKKNKKFRDWLNIQKYIDLKPNDDVLEILGYIAWETVAKITKAGLVVKKEMDHVEFAQRAKEAEKRKMQNTMEGHSTKLDERDSSKDTSTNLVPPTALSIKETKLPDNIDEIIEWLSRNRDLDRARDSLLRTTQVLKPNIEVYCSQETDDFNDEPTPIMPIHIYEACRRLQHLCFPLKVFESGISRPQTNLVSPVIMLA